MIDLNLLIERSDIVNFLKRKDPDFDVELLIKLYRLKKKLQRKVEELRYQKNQLAEQGKIQVTEELRKKSIEIGRELKSEEKELKSVTAEFEKLYLYCPNIPMSDVPEGGKEKNLVKRIVGTKPKFIFEVKNHLELGEGLGWLDFEAGSRIAGSNFALYKGEGVKLVYALTRLFLKNNVEHGYEVILPPYLVNEKSLETAGNLPKFRDQVYKTENENLFLTPTAEVDLTNLYRNKIFLSDELPKRMTSWTSCFRREAGAYGSSERGLIRIHQFEKVELYTICEPEKSEDELDRMIACAEAILKKLDLHYRITLLAARDCSFASAKTYDIEVWLPGQKEYYEVSSCSNCTDFQARRGGIRYKKNVNNRVRLVNTLNASSLAVPRLMAAIMEVYQGEDGLVSIPDILKKEYIF